MSSAKDPRAEAILRRSSDQEKKQYSRTAAYIDRLEKVSVIFKVNARKEFPKFDHSEIEVGDELGRGEFSTVCEIIHIYPLAGSDADKAQDSQNGDEDKPIDGMMLTFDQVSAYNEENSENPDDLESSVPDSSADIIADRKFMSNECLRHGIARYAIKQIKPNLDHGKKQDSMIDLALEAKFLSFLSHPNIIKMRGAGILPCHSSFFIILDRLYETLAEKIQQWKEVASMYTGFMAKRKKAAKEDIKQLWREKIMAAYDIARAIRYLHEQRIIYRDLKPENIGFDVRGDAKVFDFGLSKEMNPRDLVGNGLYNMSGLTGSRRYMAPEVVLCTPYNEKVDVYSFGILLWEMCALEVPFNGYNVEKHSRNVVRKHERPKISSSWPVCVGDLIAQCWSPHSSKRPAFEKICSILASEVQNYGEVDALDRSSKLMDSSASSRRRSTENNYMNQSGRGKRTN